MKTVIDYNTLRLVRALVKLTSAVIDIDELKECKQYKFQIKKDFNQWQNSIEQYTKDSMVQLTSADDQMLLTLINRFDNFENKIYVKSPYITRLLLILAKVNSALRDIDQMETPYNSYIGILKQKVSQIIYKQHISIHIKNYNKEFTELFKSMNKLSDDEIVGNV